MITERAFARDVTADDIKQLVAERQKELDGLEFKVKLIPDSDLLKAACAIANADGGFIIIGIAEDDDNRADHIEDVTEPRRHADSVRQRLATGFLRAR